SPNRGTSPGDFAFPSPLKHRIVHNDLNCFSLQKVYIQQGNSNIFFLADRSQTFSECKSKYNGLEGTLASEEIVLLEIGLKGTLQCKNETG
uniref:Uncharacterized protein n=1 Tax=Xenopus tropicalis TaxID=8364 RepID=A0A6I8RWR0_XENTR